MKGKKWRILVPVVAIGLATAVQLGVLPPVVLDVLRVVVTQPEALNQAL